MTKEYKCHECKHEAEGNHGKLPWDCPECGASKSMIHVGPVVDECDKCHTPLLYHGNRINAFGYDTVCDGCYDRMESVV